MAEYIERSYIRKMAMLEMAYTMETEADNAVVLRMIEDAPAADVAPVRHGRWELHGNDDDCGSSYFCSECYKSYDEDWFYTNGEYTPFPSCPNCRAIMDLEAEYDDQ